MSNGKKPGPEQPQERVRETPEIPPLPIEAKATEKVKDFLRAEEARKQAEAIEKAMSAAKDLLLRKRPQNERPAQRLDGLLKKLSEKGGDDSFIRGDIIFYQDQPLNRPPLRDVIDHVKPRLQKLMTEPAAIRSEKGKYEYVPASDEVLLSRLERLDAEIASGPQMVAYLKGTQASTSSTWLREVNDWIAQKQRQPNSILNIYAEGWPPY